METRLFIKNMVCNRCIMAVEQQLEKSGLNYTHVDLGEVTLADKPSQEQLQQFNTRIRNLGFELIEDKTARIISSIKKVVIDYVRNSSARDKKLKFSVYLSEKLDKDYHYLSNLFSSVEGTTIEQFLILHKIERVKELLVYGELSLSEIAYELGYSSVQHLSNQFKKVTGLTPSHFKKIGENKRHPLDEI